MGREPRDGSADSLVLHALLPVQTPGPGQIAVPTPSGLERRRAGVIAGWQPILFAGVVSVGIAYTLQVIAQKNAKASHAAIIMSLEAVFAAIGGVWLLDENLSARAWLGCGLMLAGMLLSQVRWEYTSKSR